MRLVLDTNIVISGFLWNGSPAKLIDSIPDLGATLFTSEQLLRELSRSLAKPKVADQLAKRDLAAEDVNRDYRAMCAISLPNEPAKIAPDPDDDWVIATAIAANAELIVTGDKPLLGVGSVGAIRIVGVAEALELIGAG